MKFANNFQKLISQRKLIKNIDRRRKHRHTNTHTVTPTHIQTHVKVLRSGGSGNSDSMKRSISENNK